MPVSLSTLFTQRSVSNASQVTIQLLKLFQIPVTQSTVIDTVEGHPDHPSLVSISDSLKKWRVNNVALQVDKDRVTELPVPFIAHVQDGKGFFEVVTEVNPHQVKYHSTNGKARIVERDKFTQDWSGIVLLAEPGKQSGEKNYKDHKRLEYLNRLRLPFVLFAPLVFFFIFIISGIPSPGTLLFLSSLLLLAKLAGCFVCGLLLWYEMDKSNTSLQKICKGRHSSCEAILSSKYAKLFNWIGWNEVGFFYFAGGFIFLFFSIPNLLSGFALLSILNLLALPYTVFSIYYQWAVIKKWCRLCLLVQGLLLFEFVIGYAGYRSYDWYANISLLNIPGFLLSFAIPVLFWAFTKTYLKKSQQYETYRKTLARIKHNPEIFNALLPKQKSIENPGSHLGITLGNPHAPVTIIEVSNPYCPACGFAHFRINELLEEHTHVKMQVIFTTRENDTVRAMLVKHFLAVYETRLYKMGDVLDFWYGLEQKDYKKLAEKFPLKEELLNNGEKLKAMNAWCDQNKITFTPAFYVNEHQLPEIYNAEDIGYFVMQESF